MSVTQLVNACKQADIEQLKQLLAEHGKDINQPCPSEKCTCLHMAVISGSDPIADLLMEHGADPTVQADDEMGITPMHMAAMFGRLTFIQKCLNCSQGVSTLLTRQMPHQSCLLLFITNTRH